MSANTPTVIDSNQDSFETDVIEASKGRPIVVDFWASWCQPCRILAPVLERVVGEFEGRLSLVKLETEQAPEIAARFGIRSIPAVLGFRDGKVVDSFVGVLPESSIRAWLERLFPTPAEILASEAQRLETTDPAAAAARYREAIALGGEVLATKFALVKLLLARGELDEVQAIFGGLDSRALLEPEAERLKTQLSFQLRSRELGGLEARRAAASANPDDPNRRLDLAVALAAAGEFVQALDLGLALVEQGRKDTREPARKLMVEIFRVMDDAETVSDYQRQLAAALF